MNGKQLTEMNDKNRLWELHRSNAWDEESGPYSVITYDSYCKIFEQMEEKIKTLEQQLQNYENVYGIQEDIKSGIYGNLY